MFQLMHQEITENLSKLQAFMQDQNLDYYYISSFDPFLNEYVPLKECHRYYFTGFTGSVAELLISKTGKAKLYVDGRYHQQADEQVPLDRVEVVKCQMGESITSRMLADLDSLDNYSLGFEANRTTCTLNRHFSKLSHCTKLVPHHNDELFSIIEFQREVFTSPIQWADENSLSTFKEHLKRMNLTPKKDSYFISSLDQIAWLSGLRSYGIPYQATFASKALLSYDESHSKFFLDIFLLSNHTCSIDLKQLESAQLRIHSFDEVMAFERVLKKIKDQKSDLYYHLSSVNSADEKKLQESLGDNLRAITPYQNDQKNLVHWQKMKTPHEVEIFRDSFLKAMKAKAEAFRWVKAAVNKDERVSELDFKSKLEDCYKKFGAYSQSFSSIVGHAQHGAIIHYSSPSKEEFLRAGEFLLVDSGGFFEGGLATDCTRTLFLGEAKARPTQKQKMLYTLVLKGYLHCQNAIFPVGTLGSQIDALARMDLRLNGLDFAHGTGHGVGVNVHEAGFRLSSISSTPLVEGLVGSIEPGVYIPGELGIRLENVVVVKKHSEFANMLCFEPLNYLGFDEALIDREMMTSTELKWLDAYQKKAEELDLLI